MVHAGAEAPGEDDKLPKLDPYLDAAPLLARIDRLIADFDEHGSGEIIELGEANFTTHTVQLSGGWFLELAGVPLKGHRWEKRIERARKEGRIRAVFVDEFCVEFLRIHPAGMYGDAWFGLDVADEQEMAA